MVLNESVKARKSSASEVIILTESWQGGNVETARPVRVCHQNLGMLLSSCIISKGHEICIVTCSCATASAFYYYRFCMNEAEQLTAEVGATSENSRSLSSCQNLFPIGNVSAESMKIPSETEQAATVT